MVARCTSCCSKSLRSVTSRTIHWTPCGEPPVETHGRGADLHLHGLAASTRKLDLEGFRGAKVQSPLEAPSGRLERIGREQRGVGPRGQLLDRHAGQPGCARIGEGDGSVASRSEDGIGHVVDELSVPLFGLARLLLGAEYARPPRAAGGNSALPTSDVDTSPKAMSAKPSRREASFPTLWMVRGIVTSRSKAGRPAKSAICARPATSCRRAASTSSEPVVTDRERSASAGR